MRLKYEEMFQNRDQKLHFNYQDQVQVSNEVQNDQSTVLNTQKFDAYSPQRLDQENSENTAANNGQSIFKGQTFASLQQQVTVDSLNIQGSSFESLSEFDVKINPWYQNQQLQNSRFDDYISEEDKKEGDSRFKQVNSRSKNNKSNNQISSKQYYSDMNSQINRKPNQKQNVKLTHQIPNLQNKCDFSSEFDSSMIYKELDNDQNVGANHSIATSYKKQFEDFQNQQTTSNYLTKHQEVDQNMQNEDEFELFQQQLLQQQRRPVYQIIKIPTQIAFVE
eukprot:403332046